MKKLLLSLLLISGALGAHGPDCKCHLAPGSLVPPNGGVMEHTKKTALFIELIEDTDPLEIYVHEGNLTPLAMSEYKLVARVILPKRATGKASVKLNAEKDHHTATVQIDGKVNHYTLSIDVTHDNMTDTVAFEVER